MIICSYEQYMRREGGIGSIELASTLEIPSQLLCSDYQQMPESLFQNYFNLVNIRSPLTRSFHRYLSSDFFEGSVCYILICALMFRSSLWAHNAA